MQPQRSVQSGQNVRRRRSAGVRRCVRSRRGLRTCNWVKEKKGVRIIAKRGADKRQ
jgi:hypothetical protein